TARRVGPRRRRRGHRGGRARRPPAHGGGVTALAPGRVDARTRGVVSVPGGIGNLGPGLDVLGCAVAGLRDEVTAEWCEAPGVSLLEAGHPELPTDPRRHTSAIAASAVLDLARHRGAH